MILRLAKFFILLLCFSMAVIAEGTDKGSFSSPSVADRKQITRKIDFSGKAQVATNRKVWFFVYSAEADLYYLSLTRQDGENWKANDVLIGSDKDSGQSFTVGLFSVSDQDSLRLYRTLKFVDKVAYFPSSTQQLDKISVTRK